MTRNLYLLEKGKGDQRGGYINADMFKTLASAKIEQQTNSFVISMTVNQAKTLVLLNCQDRNLRLYSITNKRLAYLEQF